MPAGMSACRHQSITCFQALMATTVVLSLEEMSWTGVQQAQLQDVLELPRQSTQGASDNTKGPEFVWSKHWYPVCLEGNLNIEAPNKVTLLVCVLLMRLCVVAAPVACCMHAMVGLKRVIYMQGRDYVVWHANGRWNAAKDECPHRCLLAEHATLTHACCSWSMPRMGAWSCPFRIF